MNELTYSFIEALRAWLRENESRLNQHGIKVSIPAYTLHYGICAEFTSEYFEAGFFVWERLMWEKSMSDIHFADWRAADRDPDYQVESIHYEYARTSEMLDVLGSLMNRMLLVQAQCQGEQKCPFPHRAHRVGCLRAARPLLALDLRQQVNSTMRPREGTM